MQLQIGKWGNSLALRLPVALTQKIALKEGDLLEAVVDPDGTLHLSSVQRFDKAAFLSRLEKLHDSLPCTDPVIDLMRQEQRY
jgi:antitoxin MazE